MQRHNLVLTEKRWNQLKFLSYANLLLGATSLVFVAVLDATLNRMCPEQQQQAQAQAQAQVYFTRLYYAEWGWIVMLPLIIWSCCIIFMTNHKNLERYMPNLLTLALTTCALVGLFMSFVYFVQSVIVRPEINSAFAVHNTTRELVEEHWEWRKFQDAQTYLECISCRLDSNSKRNLLSKQNTQNITSLLQSVCVDGSEYNIIYRGNTRVYDPLQSKRMVACLSTGLLTLVALIEFLYLASTCKEKTRDDRVKQQHSATVPLTPMLRIE